jgi:hypothetical protein
MVRTELEGLSVTKEMKRNQSNEFMGDSRTYHCRKGINKTLSKKYCPQFAKIAVYLEFVTEKQIREAFVEQVEDNSSKKPYRLIGNILLENGWITNDQIDIVLNELSENIMLTGA